MYGADAGRQSHTATIELPPAGDCRQLAADRGGQPVWQGRFRGYYEDLFDVRRPIAVRGCFATEYECRRWINEVQTTVLEPGLMSCRLADPR